MIDRWWGVQIWPIILDLDKPVLFAPQLSITNLQVSVTKLSNAPPDWFSITNKIKTVFKPKA